MIWGRGRRRREEGEGTDEEEKKGWRKQMRGERRAGREQRGVEESRRD